MLVSVLGLTGCLRYELRPLDADDEVRFAALRALRAKAKADAREAPDPVFCVAVGGDGKHRDPDAALLHNLRAERDDVRTQSQCARACLDRMPLCSRRILPLHLGAIEWEGPARAVVAGRYLFGFHGEGTCSFRVQRAEGEWKVVDELCPAP